MSDARILSNGGEATRIRVLAASFADDARAAEARARLLAEFQMQPHQIGVETLADPGDGTVAATVLAGHFRDDHVAAATALVEDLGGTILLDIDATETNA